MSPDVISKGPCTTRFHVPWSLYIKVPCRGEGVTRQRKRGCIVKSNALWVMVTWEPLVDKLTDRQTDGHDWKCYLPTTSLAGGNKEKM